MGKFVVKSQHFNTKMIVVWSSLIPDIEAVIASDKFTSENLHYNDFVHSPLIIMVMVQDYGNGQQVSAVANCPRDKLVL